MGLTNSYIIPVFSGRIAVNDQKGKYKIWKVWSLTFSSSSVNGAPSGILFIAWATPIISPSLLRMGMHSNDFVLYPVSLSISSLNRRSYNYERENINCVCTVVKEKKKSKKHCTSVSGITGNFPPWILHHGNRHYFMFDSPKEHKW